jgi:hypothetical protein
MLRDEVGDEWADDVDFEVMVAGVVERGARKLRADAMLAEFGWDFGVEEGDPVAVGLELEECDVAVFLDLEAAVGDFDGLGAHGASMIARLLTGHGRAVFGLLNGKETEWGRPLQGSAGV